MKFLLVKNEIKKNIYSTALNMAVEKNNVDIVLLLLSNSNTNVNLPHVLITYF